MTLPEPYPSSRQVAQKLKDYLVLLEDEGRVGEKAWHDALSGGAAELHSLLGHSVGVHWIVGSVLNEYSIVCQPGSRPLGEVQTICDGLTRAQALALQKAHNGSMT